MRVFVTGNLGYVGSVLVEQLLQNDIEVVGCDIEFYPRGFLQKTQLKIIQIRKDIRNLDEGDLKECTAVFHLAALSNDPLGEINSSLTNDINFFATLRLAKLAKKIGVERFVFSSSCSTYGANTEFVNESSSLAPLTAYAKSKVDSEKEILKLKDDNFTPTNLRSGTAYGLSDSQRFDLVVNNLTCSAFTTNKVKLLSDGTAWRPLVHVEDMANAFITVLKSPKNEIYGETFNVGSNDENYQVREIAEFVESIVPDSKIEYGKNANKDSRSYKVDFSKIKNKLGYENKWTLLEGIKEIYKELKKKSFTEEDFKDKKFYRVEYIKWLIDQQKIDDQLFLKK